MTGACIVDWTAMKKKDAISDLHMSWHAMSDTSILIVQNQSMEDSVVLNINL